MLIKSKDIINKFTFNLPFFGINNVKFNKMITLVSLLKLIGKFIKT